MWEMGFVAMVVDTVMMISCNVPLPHYNSFMFYCPNDLYRINLRLFSACAVITLCPLWCWFVVLKMSVSFILFTCTSFSLSLSLSLSTAVCLSFSVSILIHLSFFIFPCFPCPPPCLGTWEGGTSPGVSEGQCHGAVRLHDAGGGVGHQTWGPRLYAGGSPPPLSLIHCQLKTVKIIKKIYI